MNFDPTITQAHAVKILSACAKNHVITKRAVMTENWMAVTRLLSLMVHVTFPRLNFLHTEKIQNFERIEKCYCDLHLPLNRAL